MATDSGTYDQATIARRQKIAEAMLGDAVKPRKIEHWAQGLAQMGQAGIGGYLSNQANEEAKALKAQDTAALMSILGGASAPSAAEVAPAPAAPVMPAAPAPTGAPIAQAMTPSAATPPVNSARAEIMPTAKVWGDKEAEAAGLYEPSPPKLGPGVKVAQAMGGNAPMPAPAPMAPPPVATPAPAATPSGGVLAGASPQQRAAILGGLSASEGSPARAVATAMLGNLTKSDAPTDETKEYKLAQSQGYKGSFFDFKTDLKKAGATKVNVDAGQKVENKFDEKASVLQAERLDKIVQDGATAKSMVSDIQSLRDIGSRITTGKTAEAKAALGPYAEALGVKIDGLDDLQAFKAITSRLAPQMRVPGSGATSDFEMRTFLEGLPGLGKTPGGNELISKTLEAMAQHKIEAARIASQALNKEISRKDADKMLRELPDPLALWKQTRGEMKETAPASEGGWKDLGNGVRIREKK